MLLCFCVTEKCLFYEPSSKFRLLFVVFGLFLGNLRHILLCRFFLCLVVLIVYFYFFTLPASTINNVMFIYKHIYICLCIYLNVVCIFDIDLMVFPFHLLGIILVSFDFHFMSFNIGLKTEKDL